MRGSAEVAFTVISMSLSLIAVFIPILLMPGTVGLVFHEFAVTLSIAILFSMVISLTITPCMCAHVLKSRAELHSRPRWAVWTESQFDRFRNAYARGLHVVLDRTLLVGLVLIGLIVGNIYLFKLLPSTFFPEQDTGIVLGQIIADQDISFPAMSKKLAQLQKIVQTDPAVASVFGFAGSGSAGRAGNTANIYIELKPLAVRGASAAEIVQRLRPKLSGIAGARLFLQAQQDLHLGGRQSAAEYQYTLSGDDADAIYRLVPRLITELGKHRDQLTDVNTDMQQNGLQTFVTIDRQTAARYNLTPNQIDAVLYDAYGQRTVSTIYNPYNQYFVVMEVAPKYWQYPQEINRIFFSTAAGNVSGTQQTQMPAGTVSGVTPFVSVVATEAASASTNALNANAQANQATNAISNSRGGTSSGSSDSTAAETMVPVSALAQVRQQPYRDPGQPPERPDRGDDLVQPAAGRIAERRPGGDQFGHERFGRACFDPRQSSRFGAGLCAVSFRNTAFDPGGSCDRLYRAGNSLREYHPSPDDTVDSALGRDRRDAGAPVF